MRNNVTRSDELDRRSGNMRMAPLQPLKQTVNTETLYKFHSSKIFRTQLSVEKFLNSNRKLLAYRGSRG